MTTDTAERTSTAVSQETASDDDELTLAGEGAEGDKEEAGGGAEAKGPALDPETLTLVEAAREEGRHEGLTQRQQDDQAAADAATETKRKDDLKKHRDTVRAKFEGRLNSIKTAGEDGTPVIAIDGKDYVFNGAAAARLKTDLLAELDSAYADEQAHHAAVLQERLTGAALKLVAEDKRVALEKALDYAKDADELVQIIVDAAATSAKSLKDAGLDDLVALSPKAKRERAQLVKETKDAERKRIFALHGIEGEPEVAGETVGPRKEWSQLRAGYGAGELTSAEEAEYFKQRRQREAEGA